MAKYKVGDKVRVRSDLRVHEYYRMEDSAILDAFAESMEPLRGQLVTIKGMGSNGKYNIAEMGKNWTDGMFEDTPDASEEQLPAIYQCPYVYEIVLDEIT